MENFNIKSERFKNELSDIELREFRRRLDSESISVSTSTSKKRLSGNKKRRRKRKFSILDLRHIKSSVFLYIILHYYLLCMGHSKFRFKSTNLCSTYSILVV